MTMSKFLLSVSLLFSLQGATTLFESDAFQNCTTFLVNCVKYMGNATDDSICQTNATVCYENIIQEKPVECFSSEACWTNFYIASGLFIAVFITANIGIPAAAKGISWTITKCMSLDPKKYYFLRRCGDFCGIFADENNDRKVTASELVSPQTIFTVLSATFPLTQLVSAISQQALCDHAIQATF